MTTQMVKSAITATWEQETTTRNKWLTLEVWKTILYHYYDIEDVIGLSMNTLTRASCCCLIVPLTPKWAERILPESIFGPNISSSTTRMERNQERIESDSCCSRHNLCSIIGYVTFHGSKIQEASARPKKEKSHRINKLQNTVIILEY
jgi:hypothetical protein